MDEDDYEYEEMPWETAASEAVSRAMSEADFDELEGYIEFSDPDEPRRTSICRNFDEVYWHLNEVYDSAWVAHVPFDGGAAVFEPDGVDEIGETIQKYDVEEFFLRINERPEEENLIVSASDLLVGEGSSHRLRVDFAQINEELIRHLERHPELMHQLEARKFEELVAEIYRDKGYSIELCPRGADGGIDIHALHHSEVGTALTIIQCKRFAKGNTVGQPIIRDLYGTMEHSRATMGILATTSTFTAPARAFREDMRYRIGLADFEVLKGFLAQYRRP